MPRLQQYHKNQTRSIEAQRIVLASSFSRQQCRNLFDDRSSVDCFFHAFFLSLTPSIPFQYMINGETTVRLAERLLVMPENVYKKIECNTHELLTSDTQKLDIISLAYISTSGHLLFRRNIQEVVCLVESKSNTILASVLRKDCMVTFDCLFNMLVSVHVSLAKKQLEEREQTSMSRSIR